MPIKRVRFPDGTIHQVQVPDGATNEQITAFLESQQTPAAQTQKTEPASLQDRYAAAGIDPNEYSPESEFQSMGALGQAAVAAGGSAKNLGLGVAQWLTPNDSGIGREIQATIDSERPALQATTTTGAGLAGSIAPYLVPVPGLPAAGAARAATALGRAATGATARSAASGAAYGAAQGTATGESATGNALLGAGGGVAGRALLGAAGKVGNALRNNWIDPAAKQFSAEMAERGIPVTLGDLGSNASRWIENRLQPVFGSGRTATLKQQAAGLADDARGFADDISGQRKAISERRGTAARGEEPEEVVARGIRERYNQARRIASRLYKSVDDTAVKTKAGDVPLGNTLGTVYQSIDEFPGLFGSFVNPRIKAQLTSLADGVGKVKHVSFSDLSKLRKEVSANAALAARKVRTGNASPEDQAQALHLGRLAGAIESDMAKWAQGVGGPVKAAFDKANGFFKSQVVPYRTDPRIRKFIEPNANPENVAGLIQPDKFTTAQRLSAASTGEGKAAAREIYANRALNRATSPASENMSIHQLVKQLAPEGRGTQTLLTPAQQQGAQQLASQARTLDRAGRANLDPLTGQMNALSVPLVGGGIAAASQSESLPGWLSTAAGVVGAIAAARGMNAATKSNLLKRLYFAGRQQGVPESELMRLLTSGGRGATSGAALNANRSPPLELDIVGGAPIPVSEAQRLYGR